MIYNRWKCCWAWWHVWYTSARPQVIAHRCCVTRDEGVANHRLSLSLSLSLSFSLSIEYIHRIHQSVLRCCLRAGLCGRHSSPVVCRSKESPRSRARPGHTGARIAHPSRERQRRPGYSGSKRSFHITTP